MARHRAGPRTTLTILADGVSVWPNRDPLQELGGLNLYVFAGNSPIDHFDPSGLWLWKGVKDLIKGKLAKLLIGAAAGWAFDSCSEGCTDHSSCTACCGNVAAVTAIGLSAVASAEYVVCASLPPPASLACIAVVTAFKAQTLLAVKEEYDACLANCPP
jgi:hypothetical protein